jgi:hypothetical protein
MQQKKLQGHDVEEDHEAAKKGTKEILPGCAINDLFSSIGSPKRRGIEVGFVESKLKCCIPPCLLPSALWRSRHSAHISEY